METVKQHRSIVAMLGWTLALAMAGASAQPPGTQPSDAVKATRPAPTGSVTQGAAIDRAQSLPAIPLTIGAAKLQAEVAATPGQREMGLMHRFSLAPDRGMVFVFPTSEPLGFWMRNTYIPLSIAFIDTGGVILNIEDMAPQDDSLHWSRGRAQYALEMRKGWFADHGIRPGDRVQGLPKPGTR
jgi:uncharacterized membrane protein (UPF0127 family)